MGFLALCRPSPLPAIPPPPPCSDALVESKDKDEDQESRLPLTAGDWGAETPSCVQQAATSPSATDGTDGLTAGGEGEWLGAGDWRASLLLLRLFRTSSISVQVSNWRTPVTGIQEAELLTQTPAALCHLPAEPAALYLKGNCLLHEVSNSLSASQQKHALIIVYCWQTAISVSNQHIFLFFVFQLRGRAKNSKDQRELMAWPEITAGSEGKALKTRIDGLECFFPSLIESHVPWSHPHLF